MAYSTVSKKSGKTYYLHSKEVTLRGARKQIIYWFASSAGGNAVNTLPNGYQIIENQRSGLPLLTKTSQSGAYTDQASVLRRRGATLSEQTLGQRVPPSRFG